MCCGSQVEASPAGLVLLASVLAGGSAAAEASRSAQTGTGRIEGVATGIFSSLVSTAKEKATEKATGTVEKAKETAEAAAKQALLNKATEALEDRLESLGLTGVNIDDAPVPVSMRSCHTGAATSPYSP